MSFFTKGYTGEEDCLYLNVYVPTTNKKGPLPVMFYVHGGAFVEGDGTVNLYGPERFLDKDVVSRPHTKISDAPFISSPCSKLVFHE